MAYRDYQQAAIDAAVAADNGVLALPTGCHAAGHGILMYNGSVKAVEDIEVGDVVMGPDGSPRNVLELHNGVDDFIEIVPVKGDSFFVNKSHILNLYITPAGGNSPSSASRFDNISCQDYIGKSKTYKHRSKLHHSSGVSFNFFQSPLPLDPYMLGLLIGDGYIKSGQISLTTMDEEVVDYTYKFSEENNISINERHKKDNKAISLTFSKKGGNLGQTKMKNYLDKSLCELGLKGTTSHTKFLPFTYLTSSRENRLNLLAGLVDSDGHYANKRHYEIITVSDQLSEDILYLCRSLGLAAYKKRKKTSIGDKQYGGAWRINIWGDIWNIPCKIKRNISHPYKRQKNALVHGFKVIETGDKREYFGFSLDGDNLYLDKNFLVHHNSGKSWILKGMVENYPNDKILVLQPSAEILGSNISRVSGLFEATAYSAGYGEKNMSRVVYATIKSIIHKLDMFQDFTHLYIDEAHVVNAAKGEYKKLIEYLNIKKLIGLTATPYRRHSNSLGTETRMITRTRPREFKGIIYAVNPSYLVDKGYLVEPDFFEIETDESMLKLNSTGMNFTESSIRAFAKENNVDEKIFSICRDIRNKHKHILAFATDVETSKKVVGMLTDIGISATEVNSLTPKKERIKRIEMFESGEIQFMLNFGVFSTGYDFPALTCIVDGGPTTSHALHSQKIGRAARISDGKKGAEVYDISSNLKRLGNPFKYEIRETRPGYYDLYNEDGIVTPARDWQSAESTFNRKITRYTPMFFGKYKGTKIKDLPLDYMMWYVGLDKGQNKDLAILFQKEIQNTPQQTFFGGRDRSNDYI